MFRRRDRRERDADDEPAATDGTLQAEAPADQAEVEDDQRLDEEQGSGPWDESEVDDPSEGRVDLGSLWIPGRQGLELRVEADSTTGAVVAVVLVLGSTALQVQPFAAPRSEGIWDDVRSEIRASITQQGGTADEVDGPFGPELRTAVTTRGPDGRSVAQRARFLGVDGPRWFLRGVVTGEGAVDDAAAAAILEVFREIVVVRGTAPMAPREAIPLRLPAEAGGDTAADAAGDDPLNPFRRGPEITEIR